MQVIQLAGPPFEQGLQHGQRLHHAIARNLRFYFERFLRLGGLERDEVRRRARRLALAVDGTDYATALRGVAEGGDFALDDILALNMRYELVYEALGTRRPGAGCSTVAVQPGASADGHLRLAQTWDWLVGASAVVQMTEEASGLRTASLTEPGIVGGKIGLSSAGLGLGVNGLLSTDDDWRRSGTPFHAACYLALRADDLDTAVSLLNSGQRPGSANFVVAQVPDRLVDVESAPRAARCLAPSQGVLLHTNHFLEPGALGVTEPPMADWFTCERYQRLTELAARRPLGEPELQALLADHADGVASLCSHPNPADPPEERTMTLAAVVLDLTARRLSVTDGPPCRAPYEVFQLATD